MKLAIFDFDGTITDRDSFPDFIIFTHGLVKTIQGFLIHSPYLLLMVLKIISRERTKQKVFSHFYAGWNEERFNSLASQYVQKRLPQILRPQAMARLHGHKAEGQRVVIVSASFENYLKFWTGAEGVDLLGTQAEVREGTITGKFATPNCHGLEKVVRLKVAYDLHDFEHIYAYGDTHGDLALKTIANEFHYKPFK